MSRTIEELTILRNSFSGGDTRKALDEAIASVEENEKLHKGIEMAIDEIIKLVDVIEILKKQ